jgi:hypothetical protein
LWPSFPSSAGPGAAIAGRLKASGPSYGLFLAAAILPLACAPHAMWLAEPDFATLYSALQVFEPSGLGERLWFVISFAANQLRFAAPPCWRSRSGPAPSLTIRRSPHAGAKTSACL